MRKILFIFWIIIILFSCENNNPSDEGPLFCWECWQEHIAPNENWKTRMFFCETSEESMNYIIKSNTYSNQDSTRVEILRCTKNP